MKKIFKHSTSIEQYLSNEMNPAEALAFGKEIKSNKDLEEELVFSQSIDDALRQDDIIDLRQKLITAINASKAAKHESKTVQLNTRRWWYAAASLLALCAVTATLIWQTNRGTTTDSLFSQYYNSENVVDQTRGDENIVEAIMKFQKKNFR